MTTFVYPRSRDSDRGTCQSRNCKIYAGLIGTLLLTTACQTSATKAPEVLVDSSPVQSEGSDHTPRQRATDAPSQEERPTPQADAASATAQKDEADAAPQMAVADPPSTPSSCLSRPEVRCPMPAQGLANPEDARRQLHSAIASAVLTCAPDRCGNFSAEIDAQGCAVRFFIDDSEQTDSFGQCVLRELGASRFSCAAGSSQASRVPCTPL